MTQIIILSVILYKCVLRKPVIVAILYLFRHVYDNEFLFISIKKTVLDKYSFDNMLYINHVTF